MNRSNNKLILAVDFDGTLALGNKSHITVSEPNYELINRLNRLKDKINCYIKIVTARGGKGNLTEEEKIKRYKPLITQFLQQYNVPYDEISFRKEYADMYIDDMTIGQNENFDCSKSVFTENSIIFTENTVIKKCNTSLYEREWYDAAKYILNVPDILFVNDETIILSKIKNFTSPSTEDCIQLLNNFKNNSITNFPFSTYINNIKLHNYSSIKTKKIISELIKLEHKGTFFHGDFCIDHILKTPEKTFLIDPNYKKIFGSYLIDAGKLFFSLIAYEKKYDEAKKITDVFGSKVINFAVAEGLRVCKYKEQYISIVNNISELI